MSHVVAIVIQNAMAATNNIRDMYNNWAFLDLLAQIPTIPLLFVLTPNIYKYICVYNNNSNTNNESS